MSYIETDEATREWIDENNSVVQVAGMTFSPGYALQQLDPIAFRQIELDLIDFNVEGGDWFEWADGSIHDEAEGDEAEGDE